MVVHHHLQRGSIRYRGYDYSQPGAYFVTMVTNHRIILFGEVENNWMVLNNFGKIISQTWEWLPRQYPYVKIETFIVMPNHTHGIVHIMEPNNNFSRGGSRPAPTKIKPLGQLIGAYKTTSAKQINKIRCAPGLPVWQRNYYEHIIRNEHELSEIANYISSNPQNWSNDPDFV